MLSRLLKLTREHSFFLFGARGTGKSTLIKNDFKEKFTLIIDLLDISVEEQFARNPSELISIVKALPKNITHIVIDEIQKNTKLLDIVHHLIESTNKIFILTGSSARKLKRGGANLLAGRAFVYNLFPFSFVELKTKFELDAALQWGLLPKVFSLRTDLERTKFLQAYCHTYLKEEIWSEQFIKKLDPFRRFLEVAAQCNGKIINFSNLARGVGVDDKTIKEYLSILEDTLIGFFLEPYHSSFRKRLSVKPKFYFFDCGIVRALSRTLSIPLKPGTSVYGDTFEHFIIVESMKLASYYKSEFRFSYLRTKDDAEIDLIVERPGLPLLCIEIKSSTSVQPEQLSSFAKLTKDLDCEAVCLSNDKLVKKIEHINIYPWQDGIKKLFMHS